MIAIPGAVRCDCGPVVGVLWPMASNNDDSAPFVERCDDCQAYGDDIQAAEALAEAGYGVVVMAVTLHTFDPKGWTRQPAVYPWPKGFTRDRVDY